jgi:hypothetical protein
MFLDEGFSFRGRFKECHRENARRMGAFDPALLRPRFMPRLADAAPVDLRLWSRVRSSLMRSASPPGGTAA